MCGVNPIWYDFLDEQGIERNSILAGYTVYQYYLNKTGSETEALKGFKDIETKKKVWIVRKVRRVISEVKQVYIKR